MITDFSLAEYVTIEDAQVDRLRAGVGDPEHTVVPEYPQSTPLLDVWCMGSALQRVLTGSAARIRHRWLNEGAKARGYTRASSLP
jgi:hypothetical protein